jgi:hypothetical protein
MHKGKFCTSYINGHCLFNIDKENKCMYEREKPHLRKCVYFEPLEGGVVK